MSSENVKVWAKKYSLENEIPIFLNNACDSLEKISKIAEKELDSLGITKVGTRKKILTAVNELNKKINKYIQEGGLLSDIGKVIYIPQSEGGSSLNPPSITFTTVSSNTNNNTGEPIYRETQVNVGVLDHSKTYQIRSLSNPNFALAWETDDVLRVRKISSQSTFWKIRIYAPEQFLLISVTSGRALTYLDVGERLCFSDPNNPTYHNIWTFFHISHDAYKIRPFFNDNQNLEAATDRIKDGCEVTTQEDKRSEHQRWVLFEVY